MRVFRAIGYRVYQVLTTRVAMHGEVRVLGHGAP